MTLARKKLEGFDLKDAKFLEIIDKNGWHVMNTRVGRNGSRKGTTFPFCNAFGPTRKGTFLGKKTV